jgi:NADH:ubiquinone oxidoreductase subunit 3 (subunit A)
MSNLSVLLSPPLAFLIYIPLVFAIVLVGRGLAGKGNPSSSKNSIYGSGEAAPTTLAAPGYRPFFLVAFFFAVLHLGMLIIGTGSFSTMAMTPYLVGLILALVALILG